MASEPQSSVGREGLLTIAEAAGRMGVSERTVYRMIRAGRLQQVSERDNYGRHVRLIPSSALDLRLVEHDLVSQMSDTGSKPRSAMSDPNMAELVAELRAKDAQIDRLLETQHQMSLIIGRQQEQLSEMSRHILSEKADSSVGGALVQASAADGWGERIARVFRRNREG